MSDSLPITSSWAEQIFTCMTRLRSRPGLEDADANQRADLERLESTATALQALLRENTRGRNFQHELRNVLGAMQGYAELLVESLPNTRHPWSADLRELLQSIAAAIADGEVTTPVTTGTLAKVAPSTILAVDDKAENLELLGRLLGRDGHRVITADSGKRALEALLAHDIDIVLLDLIMPGMDGGEVLHRIKANEAWRAIPVIVISGRQDMDGIVTCIEAGADDYFLKPFNPVLLQARIKAGLERKRWHDRERQYRLQLERNEQFIRAVFGRFVSEEVVANLLEQPEGLEMGGDLCQVTILMSDIRQFSSICETLEPQHITRLLNTYLGTMSEIIMEYQGTVDEFIGDGILAIFGAPIAGQDDADRAVQCALHMQGAMAEVNRKYQAAGLPAISMGIGINSGEVVAGIIGSQKRSKYGIVGHDVNLTSRIEQCTRGGEILVSQSTLDQLQVAYRLGRNESVRVKGIHEEVALFQILGPMVAD